MYLVAKLYKFLILYFVMAKPKDTFESEEEFSSDVEDTDEYNYDEPETFKGESTVDKPTADVLFDTKSHLKALEKQFRGFIERENTWEKTSEELARDSFIDKMVGGLRSIINPLNLYTYKTEQEVETILREKNDEFIKAALDEDTVQDEDLATMVNIYDHALETFMGHIAKGHGSLVIRDIFAGMSQGAPVAKNEPTMKETIGSFFSFGGKK